ncbi:hypothetical protein BDZ45DRAFT_799461 [Acephala macrosclerotiorum]|nr:hypothetical protein BDZ45DRAFT_799461 [Acephala macrosclerotiorum]
MASKRHAGIPVVVFEKNGAPGEGDWNMGLHWSVPILKSLIPDDAVVKLQSVEVDLDVPTKPIDTPAFLNGSTGEVIVAPEIPNFQLESRITRRRIEKIRKQGRLAQVKEKSKGCCEPWKGAFEWVSEDQPVSYFNLTVWDPKPTRPLMGHKNGRVTLAGDAARPMTYQRGQELYHSITDAGKLVEDIKTKAKLVAAIEK